MEVFISWTISGLYSGRVATEPSDPIGRRGSYANGVARRQEILDRAIDVFAQRGAEGTSLRQIAKAIGVSHAALLHYFDSLEQLLVAVYDHTEKARAKTREKSDSETAVQVMVGAAEQNVQLPGYVQLYSRLVAGATEEGRDESTRYFTERFEHSRQTFADRIRLDQAAGRVRKDVDPQAVAALLIAASDGLQIQWLLDPEVGLKETLDLLEKLLEPR